MAKVADTVVMAVAVTVLKLATVASGHVAMPFAADQDSKSWKLKKASLPLPSKAMMVLAVAEAVIWLELVTVGPMMKSEPLLPYRPPATMP